MGRAATTIAARDTLRRIGIALTPGPSKDAAQRARTLRTTTDVAAAVAGMRGLTVKLAQMASYVDPAAPDDVRNGLARFQDAAPPMSADLALGVLRDELGERLSRFAEIEEEPRAAASIGQVHRATLRDGTTVALKIQYPDARELITADLEQAPAIVGLLRFAFPSMRVDDIVAELATRVRDELDYRREAAVQARFARAYAGHPRIVIPRPIGALTTSRVLVTEWIDGAPFASAATLEPEERSEIGEILFRFVFASLYRLRLYNGDPHPGNYLILDGPRPRVAFLDFGFSRSFTADEMATFEALIRARVVTPDRHAFAETLRAAGLVIGDDHDDDVLWEFFAPYYELVETPGPRTVTPAWASGILRHTFDRSHPLASAVNVPPAFVVVQRINLGLYALLAELGATADWRAIAEDIWPFVARAPITPIGQEEAAWRLERAR
ncbi:ABC1 kinase family protein [Acidimicrobium ferrooxidans]|uniref:ABC1 kinase family protein n=1 Tax=Acidimicrobium ferrooxidans TaxID=53635 RepID=UPI00019DE1C8|nr:AarF/ABC1/UbiB kinase family protein [Acidimicrobium ferrooxidans]